MTIRTRLTFLYASLLAFVVLLFSAATSGVLNWTLRNQVDHSLLKAVDDVRAQAVLGAIAPNVTNSGLSQLSMFQLDSLRAPGVMVQIWLQDESTGRLYPYYLSWNMLGLGYTGALDLDALNSEEEVRRDRMINGNHMRVATVPLDVNGRVQGHIQVASSLRTVDAAIDRLLKIMLIGGAITLVLSLLIGDFLTKRALQPIDAIAQTARQITAADDLGRRIPYDGPPDEIGQLTETFNETLERLERLFNAQRRFVADVSHEMRTPLTTIQGNLDLMRRIGYDEEAMAAIDSESRRMSRLVNDLLMLAKADAGRIPLEKTVVDLDTLLLEVYNQARMLSDGVVDVRLGPVDQARVLGDTDRLKQLLLNLVSNGLKYTPEGGSVTLSMSRSDPWITITICDTGIGIPEDDLPHIFDRFYRVDKARSRQMGGTGLGLSIAQWIAEAHGGEIRVTSILGEGSTFTLYLPVMPDPHRTPPESTRSTLAGAAAVRLARGRKNGAA